ncbi:MAG: M3 family metallopeptidase, partial [Deltaproteobacteria bacterium]|nr:M3 family metallopeptidase [Deltaproteobacteria bacterium]
MKRSAKDKNIPEWDLSELYNSCSEPLLQRDLKRCKKICSELVGRCKGKISSLSVSEIFKMFQQLEEVEETFAKLSMAVQLNYSAKLNDGYAGSLCQKIEECVSVLKKEIAFINFEINSLPNAKINKWLKNSKLKFYVSAIKHIRRFSGHSISEEQNAVFISKAATSGDAWARLYQESYSKLKYKIDGKIYGNSEIGNLFFKSRGAKRKKISDEFVRVDAENSALFAFIYNMLVKDKAIADKFERYASPVSKRNLINEIDDKVVNLLSQTVVANYKTISHRFFKLKAKLQGKKQIPTWELSLPFPFEKDRCYAWKEAKEIILTAFENFSPKLSKIAERAFKESWIDASVRDNKCSGAFSAYINNRLHSYIMLSFCGKMSDVFTLAHELGHSCHYDLFKNQSYLNENTPDVLKEIASIFCEMLVFNELLKNSDNGREKLVLLMNNIEMAIRHIMWSIVVHIFESRVHIERKKSELSGERIAQIYREEAQKYMGKVVKFRAEQTHDWFSIMQIFCYPFYCYQYSFANCIANALYKAYQDKTVPNFEEKFLKMLS